MKNLDEVKMMSVKSGLVKDPSVSFLAEGFGNYNYLVEELGKKFVLRLKKSSEKQFKYSLENEYVFLQYFKEKGLGFLPEAKFSDHKENYLIETFLEGKLVALNDLSYSQLDLYADQLCSLFRAGVDDFDAFCKENGYKQIENKSSLEMIDIYGFNRFAEINKDRVPNEIFAWIEVKLNKCKDDLMKADEGDQEYGFSWGDIQSKVIVNEEGKIFFYDLEHMNISKSIGLSYIKIHGKVDDSKLDKLISRCAGNLNKDREIFVKNIELEERVTRVNDVVWAAMKWSKTNDKKFEDLTAKRIKLAEGLGSY